MQAGVPRIAMAVTGALIALLTVSVLAEARVYSGTSKANRVSGTKKSDTMRLRGGNDRLLGGKGRDRLHGGKGRDRLAGGAGNDVLNSVDKRKDALVSGGGGRNKCRIDAVDLSVVRGCGTIVTVPSGGSGSGSGPGSGPGGGGSSAGLALASATGLQCASSLPTCSYTLSGTGAKSLVGTIGGGGGVTTVGGSLAPQDENWDGAGLYGCTADGYLRVTIGADVLDIPVDCVTSG